MLTWFWLPGRRARHALATGRPEQARELLEPHAAAGHRKALSLLASVGAAFLARAERALAADNPEAAWDDLLAAEAVAPGLPRAVELRATLTKLAAATCRAAFLAGNLEFVGGAVTRFKARAAVHPTLDWLPAAAADWQAARELAEQGDFAAAIGLIDRTRSRLPGDVVDGLAQARDGLAGRYDQARPLQQHLFAAVERKEWREVHRWAEDLLALAPEHREARQFRAMAWDRLAVSAAPNGSPATLAGRFGPVVPAGPRFSHAGTVTGPIPVAAPAAVTVAAPRRLFLSVDGVGGFLLLFKHRIMIGADANPAPIDVPVTAGLQRVHTEIARDAEGGYLLEPKDGAAVAVNGEAVTARRPLKSGDEVRLGATFRFRFDQPNPLSGTAVLTPLSHHRMAGHATGVVLVASNLLVGPDQDTHISVPKAISGLIFYTTADGLGVRADGPIRVQSVEFHTNAVLPVPCQVETDEYRFRLDVYDPRS
jgi:hypothetical protein